MWKCQKCGKPVYFAERRQSLGYDWHPYCLKCEECGKVLNPGQHAEHKGAPYCHIPCYAALFGPKLFGHGSTTESHRSFGQRQNSFIREENETKNKVDDYNRYYENTPKNQISSREVNGRHVLEGIIKIYWGTEGSIRLKQSDDTRLISRHRKALSMGHQFEEIKVVEDGNNGSDDAQYSDEEHNTSLPYFNPRTHPLFAKSFSSTETDSFPSMNTELADSTFNSLGDNSLDPEIFEDLGTENFLSYDPLHKWETLDSLIDSKPCHDSLLDNAELVEDTVPDLDDTLIENGEETNGIDLMLSIVKSEKLQRSISINPTVTEKVLSLQKCSTLPSSLSNLKDDLDDLLCVERTYNDHDRVYHTVHGNLPIEKLDNITDNENYTHTNGTSKTTKELEKAANTIEEIVRNNIPPNSESHVQESRGGKKFVVEKLGESINSKQAISFKLGVYEARAAPKIQISPSKTKVRKDISESTEETKSKGPRALRRRPGKKMDKNKLKRRCSINGHWYDRDTSVFTPPKHSPMCVYTSSKSGTKEVLTALLEKYKIESEPCDYALYVIKETGERRLITENEFPLLLRVNQGPHEEISKIYLMDQQKTEEISHNVAQFIKFSYAELRSFLNMFYEEEENEADRIRAKYLVIQRRLQHQLRIKQGQGQVFDNKISFEECPPDGKDEVDVKETDSSQDSESFA